MYVRPVRILQPPLLLAPYTLSTNLLLSTLTHATAIINDIDLILFILILLILYFIVMMCFQYMK